MSQRAREIAGPAIGLTALLVTLFVIDERLWNRSVRFVEDIFITQGQADGSLLAFFGAGILLLLLMLRS